MVMACRTPSLEQKKDQAKEENWLPLSEVTVSGTQKRVTQLDMNASVQESAEIPLRGTASTCHVILSASHQVGPPFSRHGKRAYQIHMHVAETPLRDGDRQQRGPRQP